MPRSRTLAIAAAAALAATLAPAGAAQVAAQAIPPAGSAPAAAVAPAATVAGARISPTLFAMHGVGPSRLSAQRAAMGSIRSTGSKWAIVQPTRNSWVWSDVDDSLYEARRRGIAEVLYVLNDTPEWARGANNSRDPNSPGVANPPRSWADWERFVRTLVTHVRDNIAANPTKVAVSFQAWNECNLTTFWNGTPEQCAELTARTYRVVKSVMPGAAVVAASTGTRLQSAYRAFFPRYLAALARQTPRWPIDVFTIHPYPASTGTPVDYVRYIRQAKADLVRARAPKKPLWVTEMNYGLKGPGGAYPHVTITGSKAAIWLARTYLDALRNGVGRVYWYSQTKYDPILGIQLWTGTSAMTAERNLYSWTVGRTWRGCTVRNSVVRCTVVLGRQVSVIMWSEGRARAVAVPAGMRRVCTVLGRCSAAVPGRTYTVSGMVVRFSPKA